ncbi:hypothetical protein MHY85_05315 [Cellulomonas sp. ACRRI]|uniref:hypothetical protein n=1 Tax=Cellulomonas sp. ACRRI TaxID=2918188 RepID=UPI001EF30B15|nr:hypothetical protein [Cellulomonas sp. ACRRI]MCG7285395.1 hypothetical protein [Cellulomonas sp. ACRRI]
MSVTEATNAVEAAQCEKREAERDRAALTRARRLATDEGYGADGDVIAALSYLSTLAARRWELAERAIDSALVALNEAEQVSR